MNYATEKSGVIWKEPLALWAVMLGVLLLLTLIYFDGLERMVYKWSNSEEYGYGFLIPLIAIFLVWQRKNVLEQIPFPGSWFGLLLVVAGVFGLLLGELSTLYIIIQYSFLLALTGFVIALVGWRGLKQIWAPLALLIFMIPLPVFIYQGLSSQLQLISSELGVLVIRFFGISVYLEGNVIDLGAYKLLVVEACSGLRYLFPLACLSFIAAYLYKDVFWKRAVIFISSIPIGIFMNSFRIGVIGILVEYGGPEQAQGFLHYFEGWVIFMACMVILIGEMWLLGKIGPNPRPLADLFSLDFPEPTPAGSDIKYRRISTPVIASGLVLGLAAISTYSLGERHEIIPSRTDFSEFPLRIGAWQGERAAMEQIYIDALRFDDYIEADYISDEGSRVNYYVAYYGSQRKGQSAHSPRSCLPGGGWRIAELTQETLPDVQYAGMPLTVNRVLIEKGEYKQIVYYWFQQRGRIITNEYLVKWFLFWDAIWQQRTDGALVRLTAFLKPGEDFENADQRLIAFTRELVPHLNSYVPD